jgi:hypothetical protein
VLVSFWNSVTEPQAIIVSTLLTIIAGLVAIVFGSRFFHGKVSTLEEAMVAASGQIEQHIRNLEKALGEIEDLAITSSERLAAISGREANGHSAPSPTRPAMGVGRRPLRRGCAPPGRPSAIRSRRRHPTGASLPGAARSTRGSIVVITPIS